MPGILYEANDGTFLRTQPWFGVTLAISYGPTPGGGSFGEFFSTVPVGTRPADGNASTLANAPYGLTRLIVILPVASLVWMPEIELALPLSYSAAPAM